MKLSALFNRFALRHGVDRDLELALASDLLSGGSDVGALEGAAGDILIGVKETGDADLRFEVKGDGSVHWGDGTATPDVVVSRSGANEINFAGGDFLLTMGAWGVWDANALSISPTGGIRHYPMDYNAASWNSALGTDPNDRFQMYLGGEMFWGPGSSGTDVAVQRYGPGILEIATPGGGWRFTSPDGNTHKVLSIDNAGAPVWT